MKHRSNLTYYVVPLLCLALFIVDLFRPSGAPNAILAIASAAWVIGVFGYKQFEKGLIAKPKKRAWFTYGLIIVLMLVYNLMAIHPSFQSNLAKGAINVDQILTGEVWRIITAAFMHYNFYHALSNLVALFSIGVLLQLEDRIGFCRMFLIYVGSVIASGLGSLVFLHFTTFEISLGASGGILGLLGAIWQQQQRRVLLFVLFVLFNLFLQMTFSALDFGGHLAGFLGGGLVMYFLAGDKTLYFKKESS